MSCKSASHQAVRVSINASFPWFEARLRKLLLKVLLWPHRSSDRYVTMGQEQWATAATTKRWRICSSHLEVLSASELLRFCLGQATSCRRCGLLSSGGFFSFIPFRSERFCRGAKTTINSSLRDVHTFVMMGRGKH